VRGALCLLCLTLAVAGCRTNKGPDANYVKGAKLFQQLYASELDDAYGDPKMDQVVVLLKMVDGNSMDADAAQTMLRAIDHGREELAKSRAAREQMGRAAAAGQTAITNIDPTKVLAASEPDAGPPQDPYGPGAAIADINAASGGCLAEFEPFNETGSNIAGTIYRMTRSQGCADKLPGFVGQAILVVNGRIYRRIADFAPTPATTTQMVATTADAGPARAPYQQPVFLPDGGPDYQVSYSGQPQEGAAPPDASY
jgi:hypothetical protein